CRVGQGAWCSRAGSDGPGAPRPTGSRPATTMVGRVARGLGRTHSTSGDLTHPVRPVSETRYSPSMRDDSDIKPILAVTGLARESRIAAGAGVEVVCSGGD